MVCLYNRTIVNFSFICDNSEVLSKKDMTYIQAHCEGQIGNFTCHWHILDGTIFIMVLSETGPSPLSSGIRTYNLSSFRL